MHSERTKSTEPRPPDSYEVTKAIARLQRIRNAIVKRAGASRSVWALRQCAICGAAESEHCRAEVGQVHQCPRPTLRR